MRFNGILIKYRRSQLQQQQQQQQQQPTASHVEFTVGGG